MRSLRLLAPRDVRALTSRRDGIAAYRVIENFVIENFHETRGALSPSRKNERKRAQSSCSHLTRAAECKKLNARIDDCGAEASQLSRPRGVASRVRWEGGQSQTRFDRKNALSSMPGGFRRQ